MHTISYYVNFFNSTITLTLQCRLHNDSSLDSNLGKKNIKYEVDENALWSTTNIINNSNKITSLPLDLSKYIGVRIDCVFNYSSNVTSATRTQNFIYKDDNTHIMDGGGSYRKVKLSDAGIEFTIISANMCCPVAIYGLVSK